MTDQATNNNYEQKIEVRCSTEKVFKALTTDIDKWWGKLDNPPSSIGDVFRISFGGESYWEFEIIEMARPSQLKWKCVASNQDHNLKGIDEEWLHTTLEWNINVDGNGTLVNFVHFGLLPDAVCYEVCSAGWDFYILESLRAYLNEGKGKPLRK